MSILFSFWFLIASTLIPLLSDFAKLNDVQNQLGEYHSIEGHPKAKGVNLKIKAPKGWEVKEGDRPNIVAKFVNGAENYLVMVKDLPTFFSKSQARELFSDPEYVNNLSEEFEKIFNNIKISNQRIVTVDNYPALEFEVSGSKEQFGLIIHFKMKNWQIVYEDKIINLQGTAINNEKSSTLLNFFTMLTNSVVLPDQYLTP